MYTIYHFVSSVSIIARSFFIRFSLWRPWRFMLLVGILMSMFSLVLLLCKLEEPYKTLEEKKILQTYLFFFFLQQRGEKCLTSLLQAPQVRAMAVNKVQQKLYSMSRFCLPVNLLPCVHRFVIFNHNNKAMHEYCFIWMVAGWPYCQRYYSATGCLQGE